jgi:hypothetical protein
MSDTVERVTDGSHRCACVMIFLEGGGENRCNVTVESADEPFCNDCEERHPHVDKTKATISAVLPTKGEARG